MTLEEWNNLKAGDIVYRINIAGRVEHTNSTNPTLKVLGRDGWGVMLEVLEEIRYRGYTTKKVGDTVTNNFFDQYELKLTNRSENILPSSKISKTRFISPAKGNHLCNSCQTEDNRIYVGLFQTDCITKGCPNFKS